jgi:hypothetical protein
MTAEARITFEDPSTGLVQVEVGGHEIQFGGSDGDGYCYAHQSFDCLDHLEPSETEAVADL